jgi:hypothetical protein
MMYCYKCGLQIPKKALECEHCGVYTAHVMRPRFYKFSVAMAACLITAPFLSFVADFTAQFTPYFLIVFGAIGLPLAIVSGRKSAIALNAAAIMLWVLLVITPYFVELAESDKSRSDSGFGESIYAEYAEKNRERYGVS